MRIHIFPIGTEFITRGKRPKRLKVVDQLTTTNSEGYVVKIEYVCEHDFCGQMITSFECEATVALGACKLQGVDKVSELKLT